MLALGTGKTPVPLCSSGWAGQMMVIDPLQHPAWDTLLAAHPDSSFFQGTAWARVLTETYGHCPVYFSRFAGGQLKALLPVMEVSSPWTGRRGVSLPFTDFCSPLPAADAEHRKLFEAALAHGRERRWRYLECRGGGQGRPDATPSLTFWGHVIQLEGGERGLFDNLDGSTRRGIRKAEGARLQVDFGQSLESIRIYYALHCRTRHRHGLPPQPFRFFANIARHVLAPGHGFVAIARLEQRPVAAAVFFHHGRQALYKFGASDQAFQQLRPNNLLMWEGIRRCAGRGCARLHLGRTSLANEGLRRFKLGLGAREEKIEYFRYDLVKRAFVTGVDRSEGWANAVFRCLPPPLLRLAGRLLYPHMS